MPNCQRRWRYQMVDIISTMGCLSPCYTAPSVSTNNWPLVRARLKTFQRLGIPVRGHGLLCPRRPYLPEWMGGTARRSNVWLGVLPRTPSHDREKVWLQHIYNACEATRGLVVCQDVFSQVFGPAGFKPIALAREAFQVARVADPTTPKFVNEVLTIPDRNWDVLFSRLPDFQPDGVSVQIHADIDADFDAIARRLQSIGEKVAQAGLRFHVSEVQIPIRPHSPELLSRQSTAHQLLFDAAIAARAECYIIWGDNDRVARIPRTTERTNSSGFYDSKLPIAIKPALAALLAHPQRGRYVC